jgi:molybdenum cofactor cytidylyltransferase
VLLCGGAGRRFGGDKLLAGTPPIGERAALNLREAVGGVLAVVPAGSAALAELLERAGCEVLATDRTSRGMGASLAAAIEASSGRHGWIVALGDMPAVSPATIRAVADALARGASLAAPFDAESGKRGHPVGFSAALRPELLALDGDTGARGVLERHADRMVRVVVRDPGIFVDIDTVEDLQRGVN